MIDIAACEMPLQRSMEAFSDHRSIVDRKGNSEEREWLDGSEFLEKNGSWNYSLPLASIPIFDHTFDE